MSIRHMHRTAAFALCISVALTGCAWCGAPGGASQSDSSASSSSSASTQNNGAKIAPTLKDYIQSLLDADKGTMSDQQRSALERAVQNDGKVSRSDYERAWSDYRQCIVDKGYSVPELQRYSSGVYALPLIRHLQGHPGADQQAQRGSCDMRPAAYHEHRHGVQTADRQSDPFNEQQRRRRRLFAPGERQAEKLHRRTVGEGPRIRSQWSDEQCQGVGLPGHLRRERDTGRRDAMAAVPVSGTPGTRSHFPDLS